MSYAPLLFATIGVAFASALLMTFLVGVLRMMDQPDEDRKTRVGHRTATPSSGGMGFVPAIFVSLILLSPHLFSVNVSILALAVGVGVSMLLGLMDDLIKVPAKTKLVLQVAIGLGMAWYGVRAEVIEPGFDKVRDFGLIGGLLLSTLWIVTVSNAVNFMDGANGLSMGMAMFAALGFAAIFGFLGHSELSLISAALVGALGGFLVLNTPGRIFAGDTGSLAVGTALGGLSILLVKLRPDLAFVPPILLSPFLIDVLLTLNLRIKRGEKFWEAHADHVYQVVLRAVELKHWQLSIGHWMIAANCAALAFAAAMIGHEAPIVMFLGVTGLGVWMHIRLRRAAIVVEEMKSEKALETKSASIEP